MNSPQLWHLLRCEGASTITGSSWVIAWVETGAAAGGVAAAPSEVRATYLAREKLPRQREKKNSVHVYNMTAPMKWNTHEYGNSRFSEPQKSATKSYYVRRRQSALAARTRLPFVAFLA